MNLKFLLLLLIVLTPSFAKAQADITTIHSRAKDTFLKVEEIDGLAIALRRLQVSSLPADKQMLVFESYRLITDRYAANNHFKQAFLMYQDYLTLKEKSLTAEKKFAILHARDESTRKQAELASGIKNTAGEIDRLEHSKQQTETRNSIFIRNLVILLFLMGGVFAFLFARISIKVKRVNQEVRQYKTELFAMEKAALLGRIGNKVTGKSKQQAEVIRNEILLVQDILKRMEPLLVKEQLPFLQAIEDSYRKAALDLNKMKAAPEPV